MAKSTLEWLSRSPMRSAAVAVVLFVLSGVLFDRLFPRVPGNEFEFQPGFSGPYCLLVSPAFPEAMENSEGFLVYHFDSHGVSRSSTFPKGAGSISRAVVAGTLASAQHLHEWACGSWSFGDTTLVMGAVGQSECRKVKDISANLASAMLSQCGIPP